MGGRSSKSSTPRNRFAQGSSSVNYYATSLNTDEFRSSSTNEVKTYTQSNVSPLQVHENVENQPQEWRQLREPNSFLETGSMGNGSNEDDFYDGIPRLPRALSQKSRSMSLRLGKAGTLAVEVLDTLGSSMTRLNQRGGFVSGVTTKGNELQILAFEVANTIVKGSSLVQFLSKRSVRRLKEVVFVAEGVQLLVSKDMNELLTIVAADKREELKIFAGEVVRFGNRCKDPQWHNLDRYFEKRSKEVAPPRMLQEDAEQTMLQMMTLVQCTADLYNELQALDQFFEQDYQRKRQDVDNLYAARRGDKLATSRMDLKSQKKLIKNLKKKSLWSRSLEEVMEKLVDIVLFLNREIRNVFGNTDDDEPTKLYLGSRQRLGPAGLALHYANIVIQIDTIVARCNSMPSSLRDSLYQSLPPYIKSSFRSKLQSFHVKEGLTIPDIKDEMEKTLHWLVPVAISTAKFHHGFGWVGEWANTGSEANRKSTTGPIDVIRIETFHYADKEKTEAYVVDLLLWLNHLIYQSKVGANSDEKKSAEKSQINTTPKKIDQLPVQSTASAPSPELSIKDKEMQQDISDKNGHKE